MTVNALKASTVKLSLPLEYQQDLFQELRSEDELIVLAHGLGLLRIVTNFLHSYDVAGNNLIILVGADERENAWIGESLAEQTAASKSTNARGLTTVNTDLTNVGAREKLYANGGIFSITSRILVVDLLSQLLDPAIITGMVVLHSERVVATSIEAFIVRIYRQRNKIGFLKAFSDNPEPLTMGFAPLSASLRNLFLQRPSIWPRFHATVAKSLEGHRKAEVVEFEVPMSDHMRNIQNAVLECVEVSISELRKAGTGLELEDWTIDGALHRSFDVIIRRQLDPVWHRISFRTKQIVNDLAVLKGILHGALLTYDSVSFHKYLDTIRAAHQPSPGSTRYDQSPWLFLDAANTLFTTAKQRVFTSRPGAGQGKVTDSAIPDDFHLVLEEQPKWELLAEILEEIEKDSYFNPTSHDDSSSAVLIMCSDQSTCRQIREYVNQMHSKSNILEDRNKGTQTYSADLMLRKKFKEYLEWKKQFVRINATLFEENQKALDTYAYSQRNLSSRGKPPPNKRRRVRGGSSVASQTERIYNAAIDDGVSAGTEPVLLPADIQSDRDMDPRKGDFEDHYDDAEEFFELYESDDLMIVHRFDGDMDEQLLEELRPRYVIMYEPDAAFVRRVEVYRSSHTDRNVRVYFMYYEGSVEEQRYLSAVRKEKDAFTKLIRERANMAMTLNHKGALSDPQEQFLRTVNTRIAGGGRLAATATPPVVVVDVREFRSSLPSLLHGRSMIVVPCTLAVADYVLSPTICVERKSIRDLISSFKSGRLFNQVDAMLQHYPYPMLLIEFEQNKSFTLDIFGDRTTPLTPSSTSSDLQSKLVMLTVAFPKLKVIWSSSPYQTAEIFEELKKNQDEPDPMKAVQIGLEAGEEPGEQSFNQAPHDMLRTIPGITGSNLVKITSEMENIVELSNLSEEQLGDLVGKETGRQIYRFFNRSVFND